MDINRIYSEENLQSLLSKMNERDEQIFDMLQLLLMSAEDTEKGQKDIIAKLIDIKQSTEGIHSKLDNILEKLNSLQNEFAELKAERRDLEQKIMLMMSKLQKLEDSITEEEIEDYIGLAKSLYDNWESLDALTKRFLPLAEYLYSKLQKYESADYSPVILELCRAIENEFLLKIFRKYTLDLISRKGNGLNGFLAVDRSSPNLVSKTGQFVKAINRANRTGKPEYTLGQMNTILSILKESQTVSLSPLLQDFESYLNDNTEATMLLDATYIQKINEIVNDYRNPSAHPDFMSIQKADECKRIMPDRIDYLMDCVS